MYQQASRQNTAPGTHDYTSQQMLEAHVYPSVYNDHELDDRQYAPPPTPFSHYHNNHDLMVPPYGHHAYAGNAPEDHAQLGTSSSIANYDDAFGQLSSFQSLGEMNDSHAHMPFGEASSGTRQEESEDRDNSSGSKAAMGGDPDRMAKKTRARKRVPAMHEASPRYALAQETEDDWFAPLPIRNAEDEAREANRLLLRDEWKARKLNVQRMDPRTIAEAIAEIKIRNPHIDATIAKLATKVVKRAAFGIPGYAKRYQYWTYEYTNKIKNLRLRYRKFQRVNAEQLQQIILAEFRNLENLGQGSRENVWLGNEKE